MAGGLLGDLRDLGNFSNPLSTLSKLDSLYNVGYRDSLSTFVNENAPPWAQQALNANNPLSRAANNWLYDPSHMDELQGAYNAYNTLDSLGGEAEWRLQRLGRAFTFPYQRIGMSLGIIPPTPPARSFNPYSGVFNTLRHMYDAGHAKGATNEQRRIAETARGFLSALQR